MNPSSHILHIITAFDRGGAENHLAELVRHQRTSGMKVTIGYLRGRGGWAPAMRDLGAEVLQLGLRFYGDLRPLVRLRGLIANGQFGLVHAHLPPAELYTRLALLGIPASRLPLVISKHNDCPFHRVPGERIVEHWVARRAASVIGISEAVCRYMASRGVAKAPQALVEIPYGIDVAPYEVVSRTEVAALRREWGADNETLLIGFAGRLVAQKSIPTLIEAFARFNKESGCNAKLVIVGHGPLEETLRRCAKSHGVADLLIWAGFRSDMPVVMSAFDVFALTSNHEGFGLVLIEAMAAGRPIVATRVSAIPEVVVDGETGLLAQPRSPASVADALLRMKDGALRSRLGTAGRRRAFEHFTLERMYAATDAVYARCLRDRQCFTKSAETAALMT